MTAILEVVGLRKSFGPVEALRGADLQLRAGEVLAVVGDNGAGKSTLIEHISGVYRPDAGQMLLAGKPLDLASPREARERGIEAVYQDLALANDLSIELLRQYFCAWRSLRWRHVRADQRAGSQSIPCRRADDRPSRQHRIPRNRRSRCDALPARSTRASPRDRRRSDRPGTAIFACLAGGDVTIVDHDEERLDLALTAGAAARLIKADDRVADLVRETSSGEGFVVVFDATGNRASMEAALAHVAHGGALVFVGVLAAQISFSDPEFHKREMTVLGSRNALRSDFETVMAAIEGGRVPLQRLLAHRTNLKIVAADLPRWSTDKKGLVKALVDVG